MSKLYGKSKREIAELLRSKDIHPTAQRIEMAWCLLSRPQHLSADEIRLMLNQEYEQVSQATVYNNLKLFAKKGVVQELIVSSDRIYYDSNPNPHHHFLDLDTGKIEDIPNCALQISQMNINACIEDVSVIVKGRRKQLDLEQVHP
ncbi:MAG: transcriptional repressor [Leptospiraceae bacterium]|nr:transcriptional repressor [Leptospiraceae bacterium]